MKYLIFICLILALVTMSATYKNKKRSRSCKFLIKRITRLERVYNNLCHNAKGYVDSLRCLKYANKILIKILLLQHLGCINLDHEHNRDCSTSTEEHGDTSEEHDDTSEEHDDSSEEHDDTSEEHDDTSEEHDDTSEEYDTSEEDDDSSEEIIDSPVVDPALEGVCVAIGGMCDVDGTLTPLPECAAQVGNECNVDGTINCVICI